jgi:hypothetical protein
MTIPDAILVAREFCSRRQLSVSTGKTCTYWLRPAVSRIKLQPFEGPGAAFLGE